REFGVTDKFPLCGADGLPFRKARVWAVDEIFEQRAITPASSVALENRDERFAMHGFRDGDAGEVQQRGSDIHVEGNLFRPGTGFDEFRVTHHHWYTDAFFVSPAFVSQAVFAPEITVIAGEDEQGVVELFCFFEGGDHFADAIID